MDYGIFGFYIKCLKLLLIKRDFEIEEGKLNSTLNHGNFNFLEF